MALPLNVALLLLLSALWAIRLNMIKYIIEVKGRASLADDQPRNTDGGPELVVHERAPRPVPYFLRGMVATRAKGVFDWHSARPLPAWETPLARAFK